VGRQACTCISGIDHPAAQDVGGCSVAWSSSTRKSNVRNAAFGSGGELACSDTAGKATAIVHDAEPSPAPHLHTSPLECGELKILLTAALRALGLTVARVVLEGGYVWLGMW
jgi:hypothetical protein